MADSGNKYSENTGPGPYYVDKTCIDCHACNETAPEFFTSPDGGGYSFVFKQPTTPEEAEKCEEAMDGCPVEAIGNDGMPLPD
ncbi:MAG: ferredoxin [Chrysiogenetes bacterium]|nr:ferredoxin [Chrysiogenetes bacterium]